MTDRLRFDLAGLTRICTWALGLFVLAEIANSAYNIYFLHFLTRIEAGDVDFDTADLLDQLAIIIGISYLVLFLGAAILSSVWIYRASWNARQIQPDTARIRPGWAVGWFAVPIACYFLPYKAMKQCWRSSHDPTGGIDGPVPGFMGWWWAAWVLNTLVANAVFRLHARAETIDDVRLAYGVELASAPLALTAAILFARVIRGIATAQSRQIPARVAEASLSGQGGGSPA